MHVEEGDQFVQRMFENHPLELVLVTQVSKGVQIMARNGFQLQLQPESTAKVLDTVAEGDAVSSTFLLALLHALRVKLILQRALEFASAVDGIRGAVSTDRLFYQKNIESWGLFGCS